MDSPLKALSKKQLAIAFVIQIAALVIVFFRAFDTGSLWLYGLCIILLLAIIHTLYLGWESITFKK